MQQFKTSVPVLIALLIVSFSVKTFGQPAASSKPHIGVLDLEGRGISEGEAATLTDRLRGHLVNTNAFVVLERAKMEDILKEQGFQQTGCTITECAVRAGRVLNAKKMVAGSIGLIGKTYTIDLLLIDVESGQIERSFNRDYRGAIDGLLHMLEEMAQEMVVASAGKKPTVEAKRAHKLTIYSSPNGAEIIINNQAIGKTPFTGNIKIGSRLNIRLKYRGYKDWEKALTMTRDEDLNAELAPQAKSSSRTWLWIAGGVGVAALGATAYILTSPDESGGGTKNESLPPFQWPPEGK
jgi:hypothetical protein